MLKRLAALAFIIAWIAAVLLWSEWHTARTAEKNAQFARNLADPNVAPILSDIQADPSWTIRKWLTVDDQNSDCAAANEMMDRGATEKQLTKRGVVVRTYKLSDYVHSCETFASTMMVDVVDPQAKKWCAFRKSGTRFEQLCNEWTRNRSVYLVRAKAQSKPTVERYRQMVGI